MKNIIRLFMLSLITVMFFMGCEDPVKTKADFQQNYVLNSVIRGDTSFQVATVLKNYDVPGLDPNVNTQSQFIEGSIIRLWYKDTVYFMRDSLVFDPVVHRYDDPYKFYYIDGFRPDAGSYIEIEALLPNGKRLSSSTRLPERINFSEDSDYLIPPENRKTVTIRWKTERNGLMFLPRLTLRYNQIVGGVEVAKTVIVPAQFLNRNGVTDPYYPQASKETGIVYEFSAIDKVLQDISAEDENKGNFEIIHLYLEIATFDENLTSYYSSTNNIVNEYSIRLDELDVTNIDGGLGIFCSYIKNGVVIYFDELYIKKYGYKLGTN
ncbi:MAG: hypothetical protein K9G57_01625 [Ignavibacteriales bacterium]|nr:hypothetical protein [Ignavibacteriales bacterium]